MMRVRNATGPGFCQLVAEHFLPLGGPWRLRAFSAKPLRVSIGGAGRAAGVARPANAFPAAHPAGESGSGRGPRRRHPAGDSRAAGRKARRGKEIGFGTEDPSAPDTLKSQPPPSRYAGAPLRAAFYLPFSSRRPEQVRAAPRGRCARPFYLPFSFLDARAGAGAAARAAPRARPRLRETRRGSSGEA